jgi:CPA1 family monovalent cation:H+ antiporter
VISRIRFAESPDLAIFLLVARRKTGETAPAVENFVAIWLPAAIAIALVTLRRAVAIYPCCVLFSGSLLRVSIKHQHVLFWGGLRGALALALVLGLPPKVAQREDIITVSFAVVAFSIFMQGLMMPPFLGMMGELPR